MRIGHYHPEIWHQGGISSYVERVSAAQQARGHEVHFFDHEATPPVSPNRPDTAPLVVDSTEELFQRAAGLELDVLNVHGPLPFISRKRVPTVRTLHGHGPYCPSGSQHHKRWGTPCERIYTPLGCLWGHIVDRCGSLRPRKMQQALRRTRMEQRVLPEITTITVSRFLKQRMVRAGYPADRVHTLHSPAPAVDEAFQPPPGGPPRFVFVGRIVPQKGLDVLIRALAQVDPDVRLDIAGEGDDAADMKALAQEMGVERRVTFHGWCTSEKVKALTLAARALIFPSTWHEPAGLVTLEAAAHGRPVIASRVGGIPEYALESFALLSAPHDVDGLAQAIGNLVEDRALAERMGRVGRETVQNRFSMDAFLDQLADIYGQAAEE